MRTTALILLFLPGFAISAEPGRTLAPWLKAPAAPSAMARGDAAAAVADASSLAYNPAVIGPLKRSAAAFHHTEGVLGLRTEGLTITHPDAGFGSLALQTRGLWDSGIQGRDTSGNPTGSVNYYSVAYGLAYASAIPGWNKAFAGVQVKGITNSYSTELLDSTAALDLGLHAELAGGLLPPDTLSGGVSILNLGMPIRYDVGSLATPLQVRAGLHWHPAESRLGIAGDAAFYEDTKVVGGKLGVEYALLGGGLVLRGGYDFNPQNLDLIAGIGAGFGVRLAPWILDYSYSLQGGLGASHRIGITADLGEGFLKMPQHDNGSHPGNPASEVQPADAKTGPAEPAR